MPACAKAPAEPHHRKTERYSWQLRMVTKDHCTRAKVGVQYKKSGGSPMNRRDFLKTASSSFGGMLLGPSLMMGNEPQPAMTPVAFVKTTDRAAGVSRAIDMLGLQRF